MRYFEQTIIRPEELRGFALWQIERIFKTARAHGFEVFISPHYFYPTDKGWKFNGPLETDEVTSRMFARKGVLNLDGFEGSGADWLERFIWIFRVRSLTEATEGDERCEQEESKSDVRNPDFDTLAERSVQIAGRW